MKRGIGNRLLSAAKFVRQGAYFADVGTDHAYLPLFLLSEGIIERAVCSDINRGPLASAEENAAEAGLSDKMTFLLSDGAADLADLGLTDYAICGMGGELISYIIERAPHLKDGKINLILQPMTRQAELRRYLCENGFSVLEESYSFEAGKYYVCINAVFTGESRSISDFEAEFGDLSTRVAFSPEKQGYIDTKLRALKRARDGKIMGGEAAPYEEKLLLEYENYIKAGK